MNGVGNRMTLIQYSALGHSIYGQISIITDHVPESMVMFDANNVFILGKSSNEFQLISVSPLILNALAVIKYIHNKLSLYFPER